MRMLCCACLWGHHCRSEVWRAHSIMNPRPREATRHIPGAVLQRDQKARVCGMLCAFFVVTSIHHGADYTWDTPDAVPVCSAWLTGSHCAHLGGSAMHAS